MAVFGHNCFALQYFVHTDSCSCAEPAPHDADGSGGGGAAAEARAAEAAFAAKASARSYLPHGSRVAVIPCPEGEHAAAQQH